MIDNDTYERDEKSFTVVQSKYTKEAKLKNWNKRSQYQLKNLNSRTPVKCLKLENHEKINPAQNILL